jgi:hypothetical protein
MDYPGVDQSPALSGPDGLQCRFSLHHERTVTGAPQSRDPKVISVRHQGLSVDLGWDLCET